MRGITKGEQCTASNPVLQLLSRSAGFLADIYSGSFKIDEIANPLVAPTARVPSTPIDTTAHRLGIGRYYLPTGSTTTWNTGTHRATVTYQLSATGRSYKQIIDFEVLDDTEWPSSDDYVGYISTRRAKQLGHLTTSDDLNLAHFHISRVSHDIEMWTGNHFDPRYYNIRKSGQHDPTLLLFTPVIAIEDIYAIWQTTTGEDQYKYEQYLYKVYNRHLDGNREEDDRFLPKIVLTNVDGGVVTVSDFAWPYGNQNIDLIGVFGFTEPDMDSAGGRTGVGVTPRDIEYVAGVLLYRSLADATLSDGAIHQPGAVRSMRTRDQSISFGGTSGGVSDISDMSGDPTIDRVLARYCRPIKLVGV